MNGYSTALAKCHPIYNCRPVHGFVRFQSSYNAPLAYDLLSQPPLAGRLSRHAFVKCHPISNRLSTHAFVKCHPISNRLSTHGFVKRYPISRLMARAAVFWLLVLLATACKPQPTAAPAGQVKATQPGPLQIPGRSGKLSFEVHLRPHPPVVGQLFKAVTTVRDVAGKPVDGGALTLDFTMPSHGHGMITEPVHKPAGPGTWLSEGLKLHMHGPWRLSLEFNKGELQESGRLNWEQPPGSPSTAATATPTGSPGAQ